MDGVVAYRPKQHRSHEGQVKHRKNIQLEIFELRLAQRQGLHVQHGTAGGLQAQVVSGRLLRVHYKAGSDGHAVARVVAVAVSGRSGDPGTG